VAAGVAAVLAALVVALVVGGDDGDDGGGDTAGGGGTAAGVAGLLGVTDDPAIGTALPPLSGRDLEGAPLTIEADGRPTIVVFVAHWCPHCQAEVPRVQDWVDDGGLPEGVDLASVATASDERRPNYPAGDWLADEGWTAPVLDDADDSVAEAAGVDSYPFWIFVDADGRIAARTSGELDISLLDEAADMLAAG
jgi:thiol-disulfide isomerase/thioredoxin